MARFIIHTDGASRGNPGAAAYAYTIQADGEDPIEEAGCLGKMTNNQAEYQGLIRALQHALRLGTNHDLVVNSDSELMVKQMRGEYKVKNEDLRDLYEQARELVRQFTGQVRFQHVRREQNKRADQLCNEALDGRREVSAEELIAQHQRVSSSSLDAEACACLEQAQAQPSADVVWKQLRNILHRHGIRLPANR